LNRREFTRLAESLGKGSEYVMFHWMDDKTIDELFFKYAGELDAISRESFQFLVRDHRCWRAANALRQQFCVLHSDCCVTSCK
jgi:hypothetical protein